MQEAIDWRPYETHTRESTNEIACHKEEKMKSRLNVVHLGAKDWHEDSKDVIEKAMGYENRAISLENNENQRKIDLDSTIQNMSELNDKKLQLKGE